LLKFPLLHLDDWTTWNRWFEAAGVADPVVLGPVLNRASMLIDAAVDGQGMALARTVLAAWDIINGRLLRPSDVSLEMTNTYWIVCPKVASRIPKVATFRQWLLAEAAADARGCSTGPPWSTHRLGSSAECLWRREPATARTAIRAVSLPRFRDAYRITKQSAGRRTPKLPSYLPPPYFVSEEGR
jgi:LysR substrate binding domain